MATVVSQPPQVPFPDPPYYDLDGRYRPPSDLGELPPELPGHLDLPEENGEIVENFRETPQNALLDSVILPILEQLHPGHEFALGHDCGIYWKLTHPPERGAICPDWFYVPGVPPLMGKDYRRSYVLWKENVPPAVMIEYASDDGEKERDQTPRAGKFWIYERAVQGRYYAIFVVATGELEVHRLVDGRYQRLRPNPHGHYPIPPLGVALGVWHGFYVNETAPWLRWYDLEGGLLPLDAERAAESAQRYEEAERRAQAERIRADEREKLLRAERRRARAEALRAEEERRRAEEQALRAEEERRRAEGQALRAEEERRRAEEQALRAEQLAARLRELGIDPDAPGE
ncbi:MAG: Uma2 family endonuclease [Isosphaeraceae bacterium]